MLLIVLLAAVSVASCGGDNDGAVQAEAEPPASGSGRVGATSADPDNLVPVALAPASRIPDGLNDVDLPEDVEPVAFNFTRVELLAEGEARLALDVLVADTFARRTRGLMFRDELPLNTGMLFAFPVRATSPFWNKDVPMDLDVAFLAEDGTIQELVRLTAFSVELISPELPYYWAVEFPGGWFDARGHGIGSRFLVPTSVEGFAE